MSTYLYVSLRGDDCIVRYSLNDGFPEQPTNFPFAGGPAPMVVHPSGKYLFVGLRNSAELACMLIGANGELSLVEKTKLPSDPCFLEIDKGGRFILMAYYGAGQLSVHRWEENNKRLYEIQRINTEQKAHSIKLDASNRFAYAPHTAPNKIYLYSFDCNTGLLTPHKQSYYSPKNNLEPRHLVFHHVLPRLYVVNEASSTLSVYDFNKENGNIQCLQTVSTLPENTCKVNLCAEIKISPDGRFLYTSNRGHDSITCFKTDRQGFVTVAGHVYTGRVPRSFELSSDGCFMYAAGEASGELCSYSIDRQSGMPTEIAREYVGNCPMWVLYITLSDKH